MISKNKIKLFRGLQQKKNREIENLYIAEGKKITLEAIEHQPLLIHEIVCTEEAIENIPESFRSQTLITSIEDIKKISSFKTPQNILVVLRKPKQDDFSKKELPGTILALDSIRDPGNLGTIIRLADWFGVQNVVCSNDCVDCFNPKTVQATMGAILRVNINYCDLSFFLASGNVARKTIYGATLEGDNLFEANLNNDAVIVMGNESEGISIGIKKHLSKELQIPNFSLSTEKSESLNVSVATAVMLSEFKRVQHYSK